MKDSNIWQFVHVSFSKNELGGKLEGKSGGVFLLTESTPRSPVSQPTGYQCKTADDYTSKNITNNTRQQPWRGLTEGVSEGAKFSSIIRPFNRTEEEEEEEDSKIAHCLSVRPSVFQFALSSSSGRMGIGDAEVLGATKYKTIYIHFINICISLSQNT